MTIDLRFWRSQRVRRALRPDGGLAEAEGLAAGTGLLTGSLVRPAAQAQVPCPTCGGASEVVVIDLVAHETSRSCRRCGRRWTVGAQPVKDRLRA